MLLNSFLSIQFPCAFAIRRLQLSFFRFRVLVLVVANAARLLVVAILDVTLVLVAIAVVSFVYVTLLADDKVLLPYVPSLCPTVALVVVALPLS